MPYSARSSNTQAFYQLANYTSSSTEPNKYNLAATSTINTSIHWDQPSNDLPGQGSSYICLASNPRLWSHQNMRVSSIKKTDSHWPALTPRAPILPQTYPSLQPPTV